MPDVPCICNDFELHYVALFCRKSCRECEANASNKLIMYTSCITDPMFVRPPTESELSQMLQITNST